MKGLRSRAAAALSALALTLAVASCSSPGNGDISVRTQAISGGDTIIATTAGAVVYGAQPTNPSIVVDGAIAITATIPTLDGASVAITSGLVTAEDRLLFTDQNGITGSYDNTKGILTLTGTTSPANYQTALRSVKYQNVGGNLATTAARTITFTVGSGLYLDFNHHYYQFVTSQGITWEAAKIAAAASSYFGLQGYLVTVGSDTENSFVSSKLTGQGWMGAMAIDPSNVSTPTNSNGVFTIPRTWYWVTGPEAGTAFYTNSNPCGLPNGTAISGAYNNWNSSLSAAEPNDVPFCTTGTGGEAWAHFLLGGFWNDYAYNNGAIAGYVVEYGGMMGDETPTLSATRTLQIEVVAVSSSANPSVYGQTITVTATVAPSAATGTIQFAVDNANLSSSVALFGGGASFSGSFLSVGTHQITASYSGDGTYAPGSGVISQVINPASTTTGLVSAPNPSAVAQSTTLTATVTVVSPGSGTPTGLVTFKDGMTTLGTGMLSGGVATFSTSSLALGAHSLTAVYAGDGNFDGSTSTPLSHSIGSATTSTAVVSSNPFSLYGQSVTFTASITPPTATGSVMFTVDGNSIGSGTVTSGSATSPAAASLTAGAHTVVATYSGDSNGTSSVGMATQTVSQSSSSLTLSATPNPSAQGQPVLLTATVTSASGRAVTGTVNFTRNGVSLGMGMVDPSTGQATLTVTSLPLGASNIIATYAGDTNDLGNMSAAFMQTVASATTTTVLTSSANPSAQSQNVTLTATVTVNAPGSGTPTGTVTFYDGATVLGTGILNGGSATFSSAALATGGHTVTATYAGNGTFGGSTSAPLAQAVGKLPTTTTVTPSVAFASFGQAVTFTATVGGGSGTTGAVTFTVDGNALGMAMVAAGVAVSPSIATLVPGVHTVTATYAGDTNFIGSSGMTSVTVGKSATTTVLVTAPNPAAVGATVTLTATVTAAAGGSVPTGLVSFSAGSTALGSTMLNGSGVATLAVTSLPTGTSSLVASYAGDANNLGSASASAAETVGKSGTTIAVIADHNPALAGQSVTFTATVTPAGAGAATGTVSFLDGPTLLGTAAVAAGGTATVSVSTLAVGDHAIVASYAGDATHTASTSAPMVETVASSCSIAGQFYADGVVNPANPCQVCTPAATRTAWSNKAKNSACTSDAFACTTDVCDDGGVCTHPVTTGCLIAGACVAAGTTASGNDCLECNPLSSTTAFSPKAKSATCPGGCVVDGDCAATQYCQSETFTCLTKLANGAAIPTVAGHLPALMGLCTVEVAQTVCSSGVCDATANTCGFAPGAGPCTATAQCTTGVCVTTGTNAGKCEACTTNAHCGMSTPVCDTTANSCVVCDAGNTAGCTGATPACNVATHACAACAGDFGTTGSLACPMSAHPFCGSDGSCGACTKDADCAGSGHAGTVCNVTTGACGGACTSDDDCPGGFCEGGGCSVKVATGAPLPTGLLCSPTVAARTCTGGSCEEGDNRCGYAGGHACSDSDQCRAGLCNTDGRCGILPGAACQTDSQCRDGHCGSDGKCGLLGGDRCTSSTDCRGGACQAIDGRCGALPGTHCAAATDCRAGACGSDGLCGLPAGAGCTAAPQCRSGVCTAGSCAATCDASASCGPGLTCGSAGLCVLAAPSGAPCTAAGQCASGACGSDGKCGGGIGGACAVATDCRSGICSAAKCAATCTADADCGSGALCVATACVPAKTPGASCTAGRECAGGVCGSGGVCGVAAGQSCTSPLGCVSGICVSGVCAAKCLADADCVVGAFCDDTHSCVPAAPSTTSATCTRDANCASGICGADGQCGLAADAICVADAQCRAGVCNPSDARCGLANGTGPCSASNGATICRSGSCSTGGTCGFSVGGPCTTGVDCTTGICDATTHACAACSDDSGCGAGSFCAAGLCQLRLANGLACTRDLQCAAGACGSDGKCARINGQKCTAAADCRQGACNGGSCGEPAYRVGGGGGFSCAVSGDGSSKSGTALLFVLTTLGLAYRRRRARRAR